MQEVDATTKQRNCSMDREDDVHAYVCKDAKNLKKLAYSMGKKKEIRFVELFYCSYLKFDWLVDWLYDQ